MSRLAGGERGQLRRGALEARRLRHVRLAVVAQLTSFAVNMNCRRFDTGTIHAIRIFTGCCAGA